MILHIVFSVNLASKKVRHEPEATASGLDWHARTGFAHHVRKRPRKEPLFGALSKRWKVALISNNAILRPEFGYCHSLESRLMTFDESLLRQGRDQTTGDA